MSGMLCCNAINLEDDDDIELEEVWELQRSRSKGSTKKPQQPRKKGLKGNRSKSKPRQKLIKPKSYGMKRVKSTAKSKKTKNGRPIIRSKAKNLQKPQQNNHNNRAASTGRVKGGSGWGIPFKNEKKVSISNYVEKIDYRPDIAGRGRSTKPRSSRRVRSRSLSVGRGNRTKKGLFNKPWRRRKKGYREEEEEEEYYSSDSDSYEGEYEERRNYFSIL